MAAAAGITSIMAEPIFYGPVMPPGMEAKATDCAVTAEEFVKMMTSARARFHAGDDTAAIARAVGNLRGVAASWYETRIECPPTGITADQLRNDWDIFISAFKDTWYKQRSRWDTTSSYLELKQRPNEPTWVLLERIMTEYRRDQELAKEAIAVRAAAINPRGTAGQIARLNALPQDDRNALGQIMANMRSDVIDAALGAMRDADVARALALTCSDDRLRKAIRRKAAAGLDYVALSAFVRTEEESMRTTRLPSSSSAPSSSKKRQGHSAGIRPRSSIAAADPSATPDSDATSDADDDANNDDVEAIVEAIRSRFFPSRRRRQRRGPRSRGSPTRRDSEGRFTSAAAAAPPPAPPASTSAVACSFCSAVGHLPSACPTFFATVEAIATANHRSTDAQPAAEGADVNPFSMSGNVW